jgi:hypothetical protein
MDTLEKYAKAYLTTEISEIENTNRTTEYPQLSTYEKAVIYKYSDDGFANVNEGLRKSNGKSFDEFAKHLDSALANLPDYDGLVYRKVYLTSGELNRYKKALADKKNIREYPFTSTTKSRLIAMTFEGTARYKPNCLFRMLSKTGKEIEKIAKFDEKEVLIRPNTSFKVLEIKKELRYTLITMEEI